MVAGPPAEGPVCPPRRDNLDVARFCSLQLVDKVWEYAGTAEPGG